ncbi:MAG: hypothetical protein HYV77_02710, partial [Candidatus Wildermuthbacteria bacterium]|nr:hypothetical protein [Candidatus Wildermuthbacteria bacterium]
MSLAFNKRTVFLLVLSFFGILFVSVGAYLWRELSFRETVGYQETYRLVPEKISQSASIRISLPPGTAADAARPNIVFDPPIQGKWNTKESKAASFLEKYVLSFASAKNDENANMLFFQPSERLELNRYYKVQLALQGEEGTISADFLAVEDPEVVAVFPASGVEAQED